MIKHKEQMKFENRTLQILMLYHHKKISKREFYCLMAEHHGEPPSASETEQYIREEREK